MRSGVWMILMLLMLNASAQSIQFPQIISLSIYQNETKDLQMTFWNTGSTNVLITLTPSKSWITVTPAQFIAPPGMQQNINLSLTGNLNDYQGNLDVDITDANTHQSIEKTTIPITLSVSVSPEQPALASRTVELGALFFAFILAAVFTIVCIYYGLWEAGVVLIALAVIFLYAYLTLP